MPDRILVLAMRPGNGVTIHFAERFIAINFLRFGDFILFTIGTAGFFAQRGAIFTRCVGDIVIGQRFTGADDRGPFHAEQSRRHPGCRRGQRAGRRQHTNQQYW